MSGQGKLIGLIGGVTALVGLVAAVILTMARYQEYRKSAAEAEIAEQRRRAEGGDKGAVTVPPTTVPAGTGTATKPGPAVPPKTWTAAEGQVVKIDRQLKSWDERVMIRLDRIEMRPDGKMRWHFAVWNKSGEDQSMDDNPLGSYVTDQNGTKCKGLDSSGGTYGQIYLALPNGENKPYWIDFQEPAAGARTLTAHFVNRISNGLPDVAVTLP